MASCFEIPEHFHSRPRSSQRTKLEKNIRDGSLRDRGVEWAIVNNVVNVDLDSFSKVRRRDYRAVSLRSLESRADKNFRVR